MNRSVSKAVRGRSRPPSKRAPQPAAEAAPFVPPYPPSWLDRLVDWVDRRPGPSWLAYLLAFIVLTMLLEAAHWGVGAEPLWTFAPTHILLTAGVPTALALVDYLDRRVLRALDEFRPALQADDAVYETLAYRLVTIPPGAALWAGFVAILASMAFGNGVPLLVGAPALAPGSLNPLAGGLLLMRIHPAPITTAFGLMLLLAYFMTLGTVTYHILHQLVTISRIYARHTHVNLYRLAPLHAFSRHTARTALVLLATALVYSLLAPEFYQQPGVIAASVPLLLFVLAIFVLPLTGAHRLLVLEKERLLAQNGALLEATVAELHRRVMSRELKGMEDMNNALTSLEIERTGLMRVPTWPWEPGTVRSVVAAVLLPVFLFAVQQILSRTLGG